MALADLIVIISIHRGFRLVFGSDGATDQYRGQFFIKTAVPVYQSGFSDKVGQNHAKFNDGRYA